MAANLFGRYVWLIDTLRRYKRLTLEEIDEKWQRSGLSYGEGNHLSVRTFHRHRHAIEDIFNVIIECDKKDNSYYIRNPHELESDRLRSWLIDSYATMNQLQADSHLKDRVQFEDIPSGHTWLTLFTQAMRENKVMEITHQGFGKDHATTCRIEPYFLKVDKRRWYVIANSPYHTELNEKHKGEEGYTPVNEIYTYALDRIVGASLLDETFKIKEGFDMKKFYEGCTGIFPSDKPIEHVVLIAYEKAPDYLRTLPLHESQREIESNGESVTFAYDVKITYDFKQLIMQQGEQVEVLEPKGLRDEMRKLAETLTELYKD